MTTLRVSSEGVDTRTAAVNAIYAHLTGQSTSSSSEYTSSDASNGELPTVVETEEIITTEQEYQQVLMQEFVMLPNGELKEITHDGKEEGKEEDKSAAVLKPTPKTVRAREEFFRLRRGSGSGGDGDKEDESAMWHALSRQLRQAASVFESAGGSGSRDGRGDDKKEDDRKDEEQDSKDGDQQDDSEHDEEVSDRDTMEIYIKMPTGKTITLGVEASDTISLVKALVKQKEGIPRHEQRLLFQDMDLDDSVTLAGYKIKNDSTLVMAMKVRGAGKRGRGDASSGVPMFFGQPMPKVSDSKAVQEALALRTVSIPNWLKSLSESDLDALLQATSTCGAGGNTEAQIRAYSAFIKETKALMDLC
jgi:hypothetical protein